jgi:hypothetical protein
MSDAMDDPRIREVFERTVAHYDRPSRPVRVLTWVAGFVILVALLGYGYALLSAAMKAPERERRIEACVVGMQHSDGSHVKACDGLSEEDQKKASYKYMKSVGWL